MVAAVTFSIPNMPFYKSIESLGFRLAISNGRTHHPEIPIGIWRLCLNGIQFFVGKFTLTFSWPL